MITVDDALSAIRRACTPLPEEAIPVGQALGRVLAHPLVSDVDWPPFDTSAMDGYAVRLADASAPGATLVERHGLVAAGDPPGAPLSPGEAVRIMTGAPIPPGTEAVVPVERIRRESQAGVVVLEIAPGAGDHVRRRGESVAAGTPLLPVGRRLSAAEVALAAMAGADPLRVRGRPRIAIAVTGNELVPSASAPGPGQLRDSNGPMLAALCASRGYSASCVHSVPDEDAEVRRLFREAGRGEDLLLTTGGVSAGDLDLLPERAQRGGFEILFHGVAMRPGKPIAFGKRSDTYWFGLPGNPVSTSVCFHLFVRTALDALEGAERVGPDVVSAHLTRDLTARGNRETFRDALLETVDGELRVAALESRGSHDLAAHARANALIRIPGGVERVAAGSLVECLRL